LLSAALQRVEAGVAGEATALGDALALAVRRALGARQSDAATEPGAGRLVVVLTDGRSNAGSLSVELATALAQGEGIRIHTVGIGSEIDAGPAPRTAASQTTERHGVDVDALGRIAAQTGGRFFHARRSGDLQEVYREIDTIERVTHARPARIRHSPRPEPLLALAGSCLVLELAACRTLRRRLP
jgi:Ca-activated chloride channel family protein